MWIAETVRCRPKVDPELVTWIWHYCAVGREARLLRSQELTTELMNLGCVMATQRPQSVQEFFDLVVMPTYHSWWMTDPAGIDRPLLQCAGALLDPMLACARRNGVRLDGEVITPRPADTASQLRSSFYYWTSVEIGIGQGRAPLPPMRVLLDAFNLRT